LQIVVSRLNVSELIGEVKEESSASIRRRVELAVDLQKLRNISNSAPGGFNFNSTLSQRELHKYCQVEQKTKEFLARAVSQFNLSARAYDRILRLARTIADLAGSENILMEHISEAVRYRLPIKVAS
jgi:magnesium chelatase family protein